MYNKVKLLSWNQKMLKITIKIIKTSILSLLKKEAKNKKNISEWTHQEHKMPKPRPQE